MSNCCCGCDDMRRTFVLSGTVTSAIGAPLANVTIQYTFNCDCFVAVTDASGNYLITAPEGSRVVITAMVASGVTITPPNYTIDPVTQNQSGLNFVVSQQAQTFQVSGVVSGLPSNVGVTVNYTINGTPGSAVTNASGAFSFSAPTGASVVITPSTVAGFNATPANHQIANLTGNVTGQNFAYTTQVNTSVVIGRLTNALGPIGQQSVNYTVNGQSFTTQTDANGNYFITAPTGSSVIVTPPTIPNFTSSPSNIVLNGISGVVPGQNFQFSLNGGLAVVSGSVLGLPQNNGIPVSVNVNGVPLQVTTNSLGIYNVIVNIGSTVSITPPQIAGFNVTPSSYSLPSVSGNQLNQSFVYTPS